MTVLTFNTEFTTSVPASKMYKAAVVDSHVLSPKLLPMVKNIEIVEGDGGVGTITKTYFSEESPVKYAKFKSEAVDPNNYYTKYVAFEGGFIGEQLESAVYEVKFEASSDGGSICKTTTHYHIKDGVDIDKDEVKGWNDQSMVFYKLVSDHLTANPGLY